MAALDGDTYATPPIREGRYVLQLFGEGIAPARHPFSIVAGEETDLRLRPEPGAAARIRVLDRREPESLQTLRVRVYDGEGSLRLDLPPTSNGVRPDTTVELRVETALPAGTLHVVADAGDDRRAETPITVDGRSTDPVEVTLELP